MIIILPDSDPFQNSVLKRGNITFIIWPHSVRGLKGIKSVDQNEYLVLK